MKPREESAHQDDVEIITDREQAEHLLTPQRTEELIEVLLSSIASMKAVSDETRAELEAIGALDWIGDVPKDHPIRNTEDWKLDREWFVDSVKHLLDDNQLVVAAQNNEVAGISGFHLAGKLDGKNVYEIVRVTVDPKFQGKGISSRLIQGVLDEIKEIDSNALALAYTKNAKIVTQLERRKARKLSPAEYADIIKYDNEVARRRALERLTLKATEGWAAYVLPVDNK